MKILLANPRGFCAGVNMAIECLEKALQIFGPPLYVYHEIVHNRPVVERFRKLGVVFVDGIDEIPPGSVVLYSAHGVAPAIRTASAERNLRAIDATCPLVTKVHLEAVRFAREGRTILLIGHGRSAEAEGRASMGRARYSEVSRWFARRGFAVAVPTRVGYGVTGGEDVEDNRRCGSRSRTCRFEVSRITGLAGVGCAARNKRLR